MPTRPELRLVYQGQRDDARRRGEVDFPPTFSKWLRQRLADDLPSRPARQGFTSAAVPRRKPTRGPAPALRPAAATPVATPWHDTSRRSEAVRQTWAVERMTGVRRGHKRGGDARNARPVLTPIGKFGSAVEAAAAFGVDKSTAVRRAEAE